MISYSIRCFVVMHVFMILFQPTCSGKFPSIDDKLEYLFSGQEINPDVFRTFLSLYDRPLVKNKDVEYQIKRIIRLHDKKVEFLPVEYFNDCGKQYASVYYSEKQNWGRSKHLLYNFTKVNDDWKIMIYEPRVFISNPGREVNGLVLELNSDKKKYSLGQKKDIVLKIILRNRSKSNIKIIDDRWELGENIFLKIIRVSDCVEYSPIPNIGFIDYADDACFRVLKPNKYVKKTLNEDEIVYMPKIPWRLEAHHYYLCYVVYTQHLGVSRGIEVADDEWKGRLTSNPILLEITP